MLRTPTGSRSVAAYVLAVCAVSTATATGLFPATRLAASPAAIADGRLWLLASSALVVERPVVLSLASLALLAAATLALCGIRVAWRAAIGGHLLSTLVVYVAIWLVRLGQPGTFGSVLHRADYGVSAVSAAWLGAVAAVCWRARGATPAGRLAVAGGCVAAGLFAYGAHPDRSVLSSEHLIAFAVGILAASPALRARCARLAWRIVSGQLFGGLDPVLGAGVGIAIVVLPFVVTPVGVATIRSLIVAPAETPAHCATAWNRSRRAPHALVARQRPDFAVVEVGTRDAPIHARRDCAIAFYGTGQLVAVDGRWRHGRVSSWRIRRDPVMPAAPANALVVDGVQLHLRPIGARR